MTLVPPSLGLHCAHSIILEHSNRSSRQSHTSTSTIFHKFPVFHSHNQNQPCLITRDIIAACESAATTGVGDPQTTPIRVIASLESPTTQQDLPRTPPLRDTHPPTPLDHQDTLPPSPGAAQDHLFVTTVVLLIMPGPLPGTAASARG